MRHVLRYTLPFCLLIPGAANAVAARAPRQWGAVLNFVGLKLPEARALAVRWTEPELRPEGARSGKSTRNGRQRESLPYTGNELVVSSGRLTNPRGVLRGAAGPPVAGECTATIHLSEDGNARPLTCHGTHVNVEAWDFYAALRRPPPLVMRLPRGLSTCQVVPHLVSALSTPENISAFVLANVYNGWHIPSRGSSSTSSTSALPTRTRAREPEPRYAARDDPIQASGAREASVMRQWISIAWVLAALFGPSSACAASPPTLPTTAAPNSVAGFECPHNPISTLGIEACREGHQLLALDRRSNNEVAIDLATPRCDRSRRPRLRSDGLGPSIGHEECVAAERAYLGGTAAPVEYGACEVLLTAARIKDLSAVVADYCQGRTRTGPARLCPRSP